MCTRVFNNRNKAYLTTARNMDWATQLPTSLFTFESGLKKMALNEEEAKKYKNWDWYSLYSSVVAVVGNEEVGFAGSDGINSEGLVANVLYAKITDYELSEKKDYKRLSVLRWVQYVLDNFKNVNGVVEEFEASNIELVDSIVPGSNDRACLHLSVSDIHGDSAIIEVYGGKYHIHQSEEYNVMTNDPNFEIQLKLNDYWRWQWSDANPFASHTIPGGPFPADRFERATYYYHHIDSPQDALESLAQVKSVVANASVPIGMQGFPGHPNISPTIWTTLADHNQLKYYFCNARTPNVIWVDMKGTKPKGDVGRLDLVTEHKGIFTNNSFVGCVNTNLAPANDPFGSF